MYVDDIWFTVASTSRKPEVVLSRRGCHLEKSTWRHISALGGAIWIKFGTCVQILMRMTVMWSKSKPEEFQYGGRLFLQSGNSYISAVDWVILAIFGLLIDIDLLKKVHDVTQSDTEVKLRHSCRHLEIDKTSYIRREWSNIGEMWHAEAEWHDNYGDEVKIDTEKDDVLKTKKWSLVVPVFKCGMLVQYKSVELHSCTID